MGRSILAFLLMFTFFSFIQTTQNKIVGKWKSSDQESIVEFQTKNSTVIGVLVWLKNDKDKNGKALTDENNPNSKLKNRPLIGLPLITNINPVSDYLTALYYDPETGDTYKCTIELKSGKLHIKICDDWGVFCETDILTKLN